MFISTDKKNLFVTSDVWGIIYVLENWKVFYILFSSITVEIMVVMLFRGGTSLRNNYMNKL